MKKKEESSKEIKTQWEKKLELFCKETNDQKEFVLVLQRRY